MCIPHIGVALWCLTWEYCPAGTLQMGSAGQEPHPIIAYPFTPVGLLAFFTPKIWTALTAEAFLLYWSKTVEF